MLRRMLVLFVLVGLVACGTNDKAATNSENLTLKLNVQPNQTYRYKSTQVQTMTQTMFMTEQTQATTTTMTMEQSVVSVSPEGETVIRIVIDSLQVDMQTQDQALSYDSTDPTANTDSPEFAQFAGLTSQPMTLTLSPEAKVTKIDGIDQMLDKMLVGSEENEQTLMMRDMLTKTFEQSYAKATIIPFGGKPMAIGDSWQDVTDMNLQIFSMVLTNTYSLKERNAGLATFDLTGQFEIGEFNFPGLMERDDMKLAIEKGEGENSQRGTVVIDEATGMLKSNVLDQTMSMVIKIEGEDLGQSLTMPMSQTLHMEVQLQP
ncbi:DUF6263 family protein [Herpetosiphon llansteffanensis]|uniref:DUF6263 family protein n=1 Tax=Herpetosiphon llansteffanensis TaxID=2094568 RepID=UPI000F51A016|nr:DUF6263 family protein [Herpetosiphon llansteffanensis]